VTILFDMSRMAEVLVVESPDDKLCGAVVSLGFNHNKYNLSVVYENRIAIYGLPIGTFSPKYFLCNGVLKVKECI